MAEAAAELGVSAATVRRACNAGVIPCRRSPGGHRRFERAALHGLTRDRLLRAGRDGRPEERDLRRALADLGEAASRWRDVDELLRSVAALMLGAAGAVSCDIFKLEDEGVFRCVVSLDRDGLDAEALGSVLRTDVYPLSGEAIATAAVIVVSERSDPSLTSEDLAIYDEYGFEAELLIPLIVDERVVGLVDLFSDHAHGLDGVEDYARGAALVVAGALEKAFLLAALEDRSRVLGELFELAGLLSQTHDVEELLRTVARRLLSTVRATCCDVYRRIEDGYVRVVSAGREGLPDRYEGERWRPDERPACLQAADENRTLVVADVATSRLTAEEKAVLLGQGLRSELCIPLVANDESVGFIGLFDTAPRDWEECTEFAVGVGQLVAGALRNADLLGRVEQRNRDLRTLVEGGLEFGATLDPERVLLSIARRMRSSTLAAACDIYAVEGERLRVLTSVDSLDDVDVEYAGREFLIAEHPLTAEAVRTGRPVVVHDVSVDGRAAERERRQWAHYGFSSGVIVPLIQGVQVVGAAALYGREPRSFGQLDLLRGLSQMAGQAIANARLYDELGRSARRAALLNEVSAELSGTHERNAVLDAVVRRVRAATDVSECAAFALTETGEMECAAVASLDDPAAGVEVGVRHSLEGRPVTRVAMAERRAVAVTSVDDARLTLPDGARRAEQGVNSRLVAPIAVKGEVIGTVELTETRREREFSADEVALVEAVCTVAGLALENARLFGDLERRSREAELLNEIARRTTASLDVGEIVQAAVASLQRLVPISTYRLALLEEGELRVVYGSMSAGRTDARVDPAGPLTALLERLRRERVVIVDGPPAGAAAHGHAEASGTAASAAVALFEQHLLIGVLMLGSTTPAAFSAIDAGVLERIGVHLSLAANNARLYQEIKTLHLSNLMGLSTALNAKDYYTLGHAARVAAYIVLLGEELGWDRGSIEEVREAAYLHDIGKIGVSDRVLLKQGPLNAEEWDLMRQHPVVSAEIIQPLFPPDLVRAVRHHHEHYDGKGYPAQLAGDEIPELARALCVVDSYDAMSLQRPYRAPLNYEECLSELQRCRGTQFDPAMVDAFLRVLERLAALREKASAAAKEAAARIDPRRHAVLRTPADESRPEYGEVHTVLRDVLAAHPEIRFITTEARFDDRYVMVVDADEVGSEDRSAIGEEIMADDALAKVLSGRPIVSNVLFVDNYGVWVNGLAPLRADDGEILAAVVADAPALSSGGAKGFARMTTETPVSTLQEAAVRLSRAEIDAITDGLTGLYNHRYLHERLTEELSRARQDGHCVALLFCDLDFFKSFNDRLGHAAGDDALRATARIIESCVRRADLVARYGGEEFVVVLPGTQQQEAQEIAGRIRTAVARHHDDQGGLTISIGVAAFPDAAETKEDLLEAADRALYVAKRLGRDRVEVAGRGG